MATDRSSKDATTTTTTIQPETTTLAQISERSDVTCGPKLITVEIPLDLLPRGSTYSLQDPECVVAFVDGKLKTAFAHNTCGTVARFTNDAIVYKNIITIKKTGQSVPIVCEYPRRNDLAISYRPVQRNIRFYEKNFGSLDITMKQFTSQSFSQEVTDFPVSLKEEDSVYIQVEANSLSDRRLRAFLGSCVATSSETPHDDTVSRELIKNGCKVDPSVVTYFSFDAKPRFSFNAFNFGPQISTVYVHCEVRLCAEKDVDSECHRGCTSYTSSGTKTADRAKRSAVTAARDGHFVSGGPLVRQDKKISVLDSSLDAVLVAVATVSMVVAVVAVVVAAFALKMKRTITPEPTG